MKRAEKYQITLFLFQFKEFVQNNFEFVEREKNLDTIARLSITIPQAKVEILGLTYEDYYRGPIRRKDWEFGKTISGQEIFIKLKTTSKHSVAVCFSFHIPDETIEYPYKGGDKKNER